MIEATIGVLVGVLTIVLARLLRAERWWYAVGLLVLPSLYASFGLWAGELAVAARELLYGTPFLLAGVILAVKSVRFSALLVGLFWLLHGAYDLLHDALLINQGVPSWYPVWCGSVDVVVGFYLLWRSRQLTNANLRLAETVAPNDSR